MRNLTRSLLAGALMPIRALAFGPLNNEAVQSRSSPAKERTTPQISSQGVKGTFSSQSPSMRKF